MNPSKHQIMSPVPMFASTVCAEVMTLLFVGMFRRSSDDLTDRVVCHKSKSYHRFPYSDNSSQYIQGFLYIHRKHMF